MQGDPGNDGYDNGLSQIPSSSSLFQDAAKDVVELIRVAGGRLDPGSGRRAVAARRVVDGVRQEDGQR